jgi:hypothetical protein
MAITGIACSIIALAIWGLLIFFVAYAAGTDPY